MQAYSGTGKYIFVSYSHADKDRVYPFIEALQKRYNVWYDDGISLGSSFHEEILEHIINSSLFLFVVSDNSLNSSFCKKEIYFAEQKGKNFFNIILNDIHFPDWFTFSFGFLQNFPLYNYQSHNYVQAVDEMSRKAYEWFEVCSCDKKDEGSIPKQAVNIDANLASQFVIYGNVLIKYIGTDSEVHIPEGVKAIAPEAFRKKKSIEKVFIPDSVKEIGVRAFSMCRSLEMVSLPDGLIEIKEGVFQNSPKLKTINIPSNIKTIGNDSFQNCTSLEDVLFPSGLETIGFSAFQNCISLKKVDIPDSVTSLGSFAFSGCSHLRYLTIGNGVKEIGESTFSGCSLLQTVEFGESVKAIRFSAFNNCSSINKLVFNQGLEIISKYAFEKCGSLRSIVLPLSIKILEEFIFNECGQLNEIYYEGTSLQWDHIEINNKWCSFFTRAQMVHCRDRDIKLLNVS